MFLLGLAIGIFIGTVIGTVGMSLMFVAEDIEESA